MQCPHCLKSIHTERQVRDEDGNNFDAVPIGTATIDYIKHDGHQYWWIEIIVCPSCHDLILTLVSSADAIGDNYVGTLPDEATEQKISLWPRHTGRPPVPPEVPDEFKRDYQEACLILADSSNASAALSRRCLQLILREKLGAPNSTLYKEIRWAVEKGGLPSSITDLTDLLDVPRKVGNRAAHPTLSDGGMIVDVEPWEAEWCLEVIEALYDHIFVVPARNEERLDRLNRALNDSSDD